MDPNRRCPFVRRQGDETWACSARGGWCVKHFTAMSNLEKLDWSSDIYTRNLEAYDAALKRPSSLLAPPSPELSLSDLVAELLED